MVPFRSLKKGSFGVSYDFQPQKVNSTTFYGTFWGIKTKKVTGDNENWFLLRMKKN